MIKYTIAMAIRVLCIVAMLFVARLVARGVRRRRDLPPVLRRGARERGQPDERQPVSARAIVPRTPARLEQADAGARRDRRHGTAPDATAVRRARCRVIGGLGAPPARARARARTAASPRPGASTGATRASTPTTACKTWLACDEHVDYLRDFLARADFPLSVTPLDVAESAIRESEAPVSGWRFAAHHDGGSATSPLAVVFAIVCVRARHLAVRPARRGARRDRPRRRQLRRRARARRPRRCPTLDVVRHRPASGMPSR